MNKTRVEEEKRKPEQQEKKMRDKGSYWNPH